VGGDCDRNDPDGRVVVAGEFLLFVWGSGGASLRTGRGGADQIVAVLEQVQLDERALHASNGRALHLRRATAPVGTAVATPHRLDASGRATVNRRRDPEGRSGGIDDGRGAARYGTGCSSYDTTLRPAPSMASHSCTSAREASESDATR
jgi:hypothetical protein